MTLYIRFCASCWCADPTLNRQGRHYALEIKDTSITTPCFHYCPWAPVKMTCFKHVYYIPCTCLVSLLFLVGFLHPELGVLRGKSLQGARLWHVGERQQIQQRQHRAAFQVRKETTSFQICSLPASRSLQHRRQMSGFPDCMETFSDRFGFVLGFFCLLETRFCSFFL